MVSVVALSNDILLLCTQQLSLLGTFIIVIYIYNLFELQSSIQKKNKTSPVMGRLGVKEDYSSSLTPVSIESRLKLKPLSVASIFRPCILQGICDKTTIACKRSLFVASSFKTGMSLLIIEISVKFDIMNS